jgi:N-acetylmuramoyl-L-alanine amidase
MIARKMKRFLYGCLLFAVCCLLFGCATVPTREALPTYSLNGTTYYPLLALCNLRGINLEYDTFTRTIILSKEAQRINLRVGDALVLVNGQPLHLNHPIDIYQGTVVVPYRFKEQVLDNLFKEFYIAPKAAPALLKIRKVVIDAGHGGVDPGAIGRTGLREKDVNLDIAKRLSVLLKSRGIEVVMTRPIDKFVLLDRRVSIANSSGADLFVSIHSNANRVRSLNGFEVYYVSPQVNDAKRASGSAKYATLNLENAYFANYSQDLKAILWDMIYTANRAESIELARSLCRVISNDLGVRVLGIKGARFEVLRDVRLPAVLIEAGFLSNYEEERKLRNSFYRQKIAESIVQGIQNYAWDCNLFEVAKR